MRTLLESLRGVGVVHAGEHRLRATSYKLSLWLDDQPQAPGEDPRPVLIDGHIDITGIAEAVVLAGPGKLILTLEDGRRLEVRLTDTGGGVVGLGWIV